MACCPRACNSPCSCIRVLTTSSGFVKNPAPQAARPPIKNSISASRDVRLIYIPPASFPNEKKIKSIYPNKNHSQNATLKHPYDFIIISNLLCFKNILANLEWIKAINTSSFTKLLRQNFSMKQFNTLRCFQLSIKLNIVITKINEPTQELSLLSWGKYPDPDWFLSIGRVDLLILEMVDWLIG